MTSDDATKMWLFFVFCFVFQNGFFGESKACRIEMGPSQPRTRNNEKADTQGSRTGRRSGRNRLLIGDEMRMEKLGKAFHVKWEIRLGECGELTCQDGGCHGGFM